MMTVLSVLSGAKPGALSGVVMKARPVYSDNRLLMSGNITFKSFSAGYVCEQIKSVFGNKNLNEIHQMLNSNKTHILNSVESDEK